MFLGFKGEKDFRMFPRFPVHANRVSDSDCRLFQNMYFLSEKAMATHSSTLAWKNPMDGGAWWATVHGVAKSKT